MRLLHTGDWHVGRTIRGRSRAEEFADALREVVGIAREEAVDAVLLAGDVYDHRSPTPEADALVFEALVRLYEASIPVVGRRVQERVREYLRSMADVEPAAVEVVVDAVGPEP